LCLRSGARERLGESGSPQGGSSVKREKNMLVSGGKGRELLKKESMRKGIKQGGGRRRHALGMAGFPRQFPGNSVLLTGKKTTGEATLQKRGHQLQARKKIEGLDKLGGVCRKNLAGN